MKTSLHPQYHPAATVTCACGNTFTTGSTLEAIRVEVCSNCHPFYTGKQNLIDTAGRVDRFQRILEKKAQKRAAKRPRRPAAEAVPASSRAA